MYTCLTRSTDTTAIVDSLFMTQRGGYLHPFHDGSLYEYGVGEEIRTVCHTFTCEAVSLNMFIVYR
jgi:hypothetical protein